MRGVLLVVVAMLFFNWLVPTNQPAWVTNAKSKPMLDSFGQQLIDLLPANPDQMIDKFKPQHNAPASGEQEEAPVPDDTPAQQ